MDKGFALIVMIIMFLPIAFFTFAVSWVLDNERDNQRQSDNDNDMRIYVPQRCWHRRGDNRCNKQMGWRKQQ